MKGDPVSIPIHQRRCVRTANVIGFLRQLRDFGVMSIAVLAVLVIASARTDAAQQPSPPKDENEYEQPLEEVFQTELVYPQDRGEVQLTFGPRKFSGGEESAEIPIAAEYGITDRLQVEIEYAAFTSIRLDTNGNARGPGDLEIGTKYSFMNIRGSNVHAAVGCNIELPTGDVSQGLSEGLVEVEPFACFAKDFPSLHRMQLFGQVGVDLVNRTKTAPDNDTEDSDEAPLDPHEFFLNVGTFVPIGKFRGTMELNWTTNQWNNLGNESAVYVTPGIVWVPKSGLEFGIGLPVGVSHDADHLRVIGLLIYEFDTVRH